MNFAKFTLTIPLLILLSGCMSHRIASSPEELAESFKAAAQAHDLDKVRELFCQTNIDSQELNDLVFMIVHYVAVVNVRVEPYDSPAGAPYWHMNLNLKPEFVVVAEFTTDGQPAMPGSFTVPLGRVGERWFFARPQSGPQLPNRQPGRGSET